jgi:AraC-like DNA-binding protein
MARTSSSHHFGYHPIRNSARLAGAGVTLQRASPPPDLAPYVDELWQYDVRSNVPFLPIQVYPSGCVVLRFNLWPEGVESILYGPSLSADAKGCFLRGVPVCGASFRPGRSYSLLGLAVHELVELRIDLEHLWPARISEVAARLVEAPGFGERVAVMIDFLRNILRHDVTVHADFLLAFSSLVRAIAGGAPSELSESAGGSSARTLRRHFEKYAGLSPGQVARTVRVQGALARIASNPRTRLADLAATAGFSDQAHLSREFKRLIGIGPRDFAASVGRLHDAALPIWSGVSPDGYGFGKAPPVVSFASGVR